MLIQLTQPQKLESTTSLTTPKLNGKKCWDTDPSWKNHPTLEFFQLKAFQLQSTGPPKEPSLQLKTKDNVDHAGLSPPLVQLKELNSLPLEHLSHSQNNNSLIAQHPSEIWVAMVVWWIMVSHTLSKIHLNSNLTIHTPLLMEPANTSPQRELVKSHHSLMLPQRMLTNLRQQLLLDQSLLLLKLTELYSNLTHQESSPADSAEPASTTESSPSDMELKVDKTTSSSKTHGELHGETMDTSKSELTTSAVSSNNHHTQPKLLQWNEFRINEQFYYFM